MRFSTRTLYGLRAVLVLAVRYGEGSLAVSHIARQEGISVAYLEQILNELKKNGLVRSVRGPQGGYVLCRKPAEITLEELFYLLVGKDAGFGPRKDGSRTAGSDEVAAADRIFWARLKHSIESGLRERTLQDLVDEARRQKKDKSKSVYPFHI